MIKVKFLVPMMKNGVMRKIGDEMELDNTSAALLASRNNVEIPGKKVVKVKKEIEVFDIIDDDTKVSEK